MRHLLLVTIGALILSIPLSGCKEKPPAAPAQIAAPGTPTPAALAQLDKADQADGKKDKRVEKCVTCQLKMHGKAAHTVNYGDYEVHLCSAACQAAFAKDPAKALGALP